jgi:UDP-N-acetylenolpyruvoylglucosamine reductase
MLAELLRDRKLVAIVGAHGKTTTTGMLITALHRAGFHCGWLLGGLLADESLPPGWLGAEEWVVAEIDESDGTIDGFSPEITVIVSLDWDHPDHYARIEQLEDTFRRLVARTRRAVVIDPLCALSERVTAGAAVPVFAFGPNGRYRATMAGESGSRLSLRLDGAFPPMEVSVRARGAFNAHNAAAALAAAHLMGATLSPELLADYPGACRRQQVLHASEQLTVIEDYAHHPTEIRALLASLQGRKEGRLVVVFQPHRFSRTARFKAGFADALGLADVLFLLDVYPAGESPVQGGSTADLAAEIAKAGRVPAVTHLQGSRPGVEAAIRPILRPGDSVVFVGAGDIEQWAHEFAAQSESGVRLAAEWDRLAAGLRPLLSAETRLAREEPLAPKTTMGSGGAARLYCEPAGLDDLRCLLRETRLIGCPVHFLGRGSNLIVPDEGVEGLVISLAHPAWQGCELRPGGGIWAGAGLRLKALCGFASKAGLSGFEFLEGIPGSVGGALRMNAGAKGGSIFDLVVEVQFITLSGALRTQPKETLRIGYRRCDDLRDAIAVGALLRPVAAAAAEAINDRIKEYRRQRQESQPREPSAGCVFRNPLAGPAGKIIDDLGLKGERVGDAEVSTVRANFIINRGRATTAEIVELMRRVRERALRTRNITLEPEVILFGREWKDVL